MMNDLRLQKE